MKNITVLTFVALTTLPATSKAEIRAQWSVLRTGGVRWNAWRAQNPDQKIDMSRAHLYRMNINQADLSDAMMEKVSLHWAWAKEVKFDRANLSQGRLHDTDFRRASFVDANLTGAQLRRSKMNDADLRGADLTNAGLKDTILTGAKYNARTKWPAGFDPKAHGAVLVSDQIRCDLSGKWKKTYDFKTGGGIAGRQTTNVIELSGSTSSYQGKYIGSEAKNKSQFFARCTYGGHQSWIGASIRQKDRTYTSIIDARFDDADTLRGSWSDNRGNRGDIVLVRVR